MGFESSPLDTATVNGNHFANNGSGDAFQPFDNSTASYTQQSESGAIIMLMPKDTAAKNNEVVVQLLSHNSG